MPLKTRSYKPKRKFNRRRPAVYKGKRKMALSKTIPSKSHVFKRNCSVVQIKNEGILAPYIQTLCNGWQIGNFNPSAFGTTLQFGLSANFQLRDVIEASDFTTLFDRYKLIGVKLKFLYQQTTSAGSGVVSNVNPIIDVAFDGDDSALPSSQTTVQTKGYSKTHLLNSNRPFKTYWTPRIDKVIYSGSATPTYSSECSCWLDCNSPQIPHYGMKAWITSWPFDQTIAGDLQPAWGELTIQPTYYIALKDSQ